MKRIAFIIESSHRPEIPMPAHEFYKGPYSNWIKGVISFMEERVFEKDKIFFLSFYESRIISYSEELKPYPKREGKVNRPQLEQFADDIKDFVLEKYPGHFVEIHTGKDIGVPLQRRLKGMDVQCRIYADGVPLGQKPSYYQELIVEFNERRRLKEKRFEAVKHIQNHTVYEARNIAEDFGNKSMVLGVEDDMEELKNLLKKHFQRQKDVFKSRDEFEKLFEKEGYPEEVREFIENKSILSALFSDIEGYTDLKSRYGKLLAKYTRFLIKEDYVKQTENKISECMLRIKIGLMKAA